MKKLFFLLFCLSIVPTVYADWEFQIDTEYRTFRDDGNDTTDDDSLAFDFNAEFQGRVYQNWYLTSDVMFRYDVIQDDRYLFLPREFYITDNTYQGFKVGFQILNVSVMEYFNPTNQLNASNFDSSIESFEKFGELAVSFQHYWDNSEIKFHLMPMHIAHAFPDRDFRTGFGATINDSTIIEAGQQVGSELIPQWSFQYSTVYDDLDLGVQGGRIVSKDSLVFVFTDITAGNEAVTPLQFWKNYLSATAVYTWGEWLVKGEVVVNDFDNDSLSVNTFAGQILGNPIFINQTISAPKDHAVIAAGVERMWQPSGNHEITVYLEHQRIEGMNSSEASNLNAFQNDIFLGARYSLNDVDDTYAQLFWITDISGDSETLLTGKVSRRFFQNIRANLGFVNISSDVSSTNVNSLAPINLNDYYYLNIGYYF